jgi:hypothetical protein
MRRLRFVCSGVAYALLCSVAAFASDARAQVSLLGRNEIAFGGGASIPLGNFADASNTGFLFTLRYGHYAHPQVAMGVEYAYFSNSASDEPTPQDFVNVDANVSIHQFTGHGKWLLTPKPVTPYLRAQAGLYHLRAHIDTGFGEGRTDNENHLGLGGGGGVQLRDQGAVGGFVDAIYHVIFTEEEVTRQIGIQGGVMVFFGTAS